jgi:hypothetical protein
MPKQNITLSLETDLIRKARQIATLKSTSISKLLSDELERLLQGHKQYERAKRSALATLKKGFHMGGMISSTRDHLHDRQCRCEKMILDEDLAKVGVALRRAAKRAREEAARTNTPIVIFENGRVIKKKIAKKK